MRPCMSDVPTDPLPSANNPSITGHLPTDEGSVDSSVATPNPAQAADETAQPAKADSTDEQKGSSTPQTSDPNSETKAASKQDEIKVGKVTRLSAEHVFLQLPDGTEGFVPLTEFVNQPVPIQGDEVPVIVERTDPETNLLILSKRQADELTFWESVRPGDTLEGVVTGMNKGGLDIDLGGATAFLPASQVDIHRMRDISLLIGEHVRCVVTQVDRTTHDLVVSRRKFIEKERKAKRAELLNSLTEGETRAGTVSKLTDFGAFVDLGGTEGLIHITDMSWSRVRHPKHILQEGQEIEVAILKVDRKDGKVSLGLKQTQPDPWEGIETRYPIDSRVKSRVIRLADFGAFIKLEEGVEALLPVSEMSWTHRVNHPSELIQVGDECELIVLKVDADRRRISLGLKQLQENPWSSAESRFPTNSKIQGKVARIVDFGAFVELAPGIEGLVHISELSDKRIRAVGDVLKEGQEVEVRVLKVDTEAQRVSLSMKPASRDTRTSDDGRPDAKTEKKGRKRPLRGGLSSHFEW